MSTRLNLFAVISFLFLTVACSEDNTTVEPEQTTYSLTLITEGGGAAESEKSAYPAGEAVLVTAIPNEDFTFSAWYEEENRLSGVAAYSFSMPERDLTLRAVFLAIVPEPEPDVPTEGTLDMSQTIASEILGGQQNYTIYLPPSYQTHPNKEYPILYLLHGLGQNYRSWETNGNLKAIADDAIANGICEEMIIVSPEAYGSFYCNGYSQNMNYEDYFVNEFIPAIESTYRVKATKGGRSISGLSMGGYGCAFHAFKRPEMFSSCFAMSAAFTVTGSNRPPIAPLVTERTEAELADFPAFVMECGTEDFAAYPMNNTLNSILEQTTLDYIYTTRPGRHDWAFRQECLPKALKLASDNFE